MIRLYFNSLNSSVKVLAAPRQLQIRIFEKKKEKKKKRKHSLTFNTNTNNQQHKAGLALMASDVLNRFVQKREELFHSERKTFQTCPVIQTNAQYDVTLYGTTFPTSLHFIYAWLNSYKPAWKLYIDSNMSCE